MADDTVVRLVHPDTGGEFECSPDAVKGWEALGWRKAGTVKKEKSNG